MRVALTEEEENWMTPIIGYISNDILSARRNETGKILRKASFYMIQVGILYRRSFSNLSLMYVAGMEPKEIL